jgi:uncharacterized protein
MELSRVISVHFLAALLSLAACRGEYSLTSSLKKYPADGISSGQVVLENKLFSPADHIIMPPGGDLPAINILRRSDGGGREIVYFKSTTTPGRVLFRTLRGGKLYLTFYKNDLDLDSDGFPDAAELVTGADRDAFRSWFVRIASSQFLKRTYGWNRKERDCAGLIRFAYREALRKHDAEWQRRYGIIIDKNLPDIQRFHYPDIPVIGDRLFRVRADGDFAGAFAAFADTGTLLALNTVLVGRDLQEARAGDILFFYNELNGEAPYHSMIVADNDGGEVTVIYHTGTGDILKMVPVSYLKNSRLFYPAPWNRVFLGVYRFRILE